MKNIMQQIIAEEVRRQFHTEKVYYEKTLGITQQSWNRWKNGKRGLKQENMNILKSLFTSYEWMLVQKIHSEMNTYPNNFDAAPWEVYLDTKRAIAKEWAEKAEISVNSAINVDDPNLGRTSPGTAVTVSIKYDTPLINRKDTLVFYTDESSAHIKAGKKNRLEWFNKNIDSLK